MKHPLFHSNGQANLHCLFEIIERRPADRGDLHPMYAVFFDGIYWRLCP